MKKFTWNGDKSPHNRQVWWTQVAWILAQGFGCTRSIPSQYRFRLARFIVSKHHYQLRQQECTQNAWFDKTQTPTVFLVNTQLSSKKLSRPLWTSYHATDIIAENPHSSFSLIAITYMINKLKHDILESSKLLTSIKLLKTMIYKDSCKHFIPLPHVQHIFWSNQTPINLFEHSPNKYK